MLSLKQFKEYIGNEWEVIWRAPLTFVMAALALFSLACWAARSYYARSIDILENRLKLKDDQLTDYKRKLEGASPDEAKAKIDALETELHRIAGREWPGLNDAASEAIEQRLTAMPKPGSL